MSAAAPAPKENMGAPHPRLDARLKVTGTAKYAADFPATRPAHAMLVTSAIARGRIIGFDLAEAKAVPGVLMIMTHENRPSLGAFKFFGEGGEASTAKPPLSSDRIEHDGEIVAMVVAEHFEDAREAAYKVKVAYEREEPTLGFDSRGAEVIAAKDASPQHEDPSAGEAEKAFAEADIKIDAEYETPPQHHNPIELFSTTCVWMGDELTVYEPSQLVYGLQNGLAKQINADPGKVHAVSPFIGGAFGSKGSITPRTSLVAVAAKQLGRPVKLVVRRDQGFTTTTYRADTRHRIKFGASKDGKLSAYLHEGWEVTSRADNYVVAGTKNSVAMYAVPNIWTKVSLVKADRNTPGFMRSPAEVPYIYALESAIDEMAIALKMDPVEFRRINDTTKNFATGAPYTSRSVMKCFDEAAEIFGWKDRKPEPMSMRDGEWLVGYGCAMACYPTQMAPAVARVQFTQDNKIRVQIASHDVGTGAYTVIGQMAAEMLGGDMQNVKVELGDSRLPPGTVAGGSVTTASSCSAVKLACEKIIERLGVKSLENGKAVKADGKRMPLKEAFAAVKAVSIEELGEYIPKGAKPDALAKTYQGGAEISGGPGKDTTMFSFGAEFVEVRVHQRTREVIVPRIVGAFASGRIMNTRTANSQYLGGLVWGIGSALHEATEIDPREGRYINNNIAEYLVPVNADIEKVDISMVPEVDDKVNPAGVKGLGELSNVGTAAALTNALYHATGIRIRKLPIRIEKLLTA